MATDTHLYLLYTLEFEVDQTAVRLCGGIEANANEVIFVLSKELPFDKRLIPEGGTTKQINEPFGMTGVILEDFDARGKIYKNPQSNTSVDLNLHARATFPSLQNFTLDGSLILEEGEPRLAAVSLNANPPLTLSTFVTSVLGETWHWDDSIANQFSLMSGSLYTLHAPEDASSDYSFTYAPNHEKPNGTVELTPGYGASATLLIFGKPFAILLEVKSTPNTDTQHSTKSSTWVELNSTLQESLDFEFITFIKPKVKISTKPSNSYLEINTRLSIFNTPITALITAKYTRSVFAGQVSVPLSNIELPIVGGNQTHNIRLEVGFEWSQQHFRITHIGGIPDLQHDFSSYFTQTLNDLQAGFKGGCEGMLGDWLKGASSTHIALKLRENHHPSKQGSNMLVPLTLTWTASAFGQSVSHDFSFQASFPVPATLAEFPVALCQAVVNSAADLAKTMLSDPHFYLLLAQEVARRAGAKAAARMLCRALNKFGHEVAKRLANLIRNTLTTTIAEAAELAAALTTVALAGVTSVISSLIDLLEAIWDAITGSKDDEKEAAEAEIRRQIAYVTTAMDNVREKYEDARSRIAIHTLLVHLDEQANFVASWKWSESTVTDELRSGLTLKFVLQLCRGDVGNHQGQAFSEPIIIEPPSYSYATPFASISNFHLNARVSAALTGVQFLKPETDRSLQNAINQLRGAGDSQAAQEAATDLQETLDWLRDINSAGIVSEPQWAIVDDEYNVMKVGSSLIGINTRLDET
jgi:hypothetical protein